MSKTKTMQTPRIENPQQLSKEFLGALSKHFSRLAEVDAEVAARLVRFVTDDEDGAVLLTLGGIKDVGEVLGLSPGGPQSWRKFQSLQMERAKLLFTKQSVAPDVWIRLAQVYDAAMPNQTTVGALPPGWPGWLLTLVGQLFLSWQNADRDQQQRPSKPVTDMEAIFQKAELPADLLVRGALFRDVAAALSGQAGNYYYATSHILDMFTGWPEYLARHLATVREALARTEADSRQHVLRALTKTGFDLTSVVDLLAQFGTGTSKNVREETLAVLMGYKDAVRPHVEKILAEGDAAARHEAAQLLWRLFAHDAAETLRRHAEQESAARVKQTIEKLLAAPTGATGVAEALSVELPPIQIETEAELPETVRQALRDAFARAHENALRQCERLLEQYNGPDRPKWRRKPDAPKAVATGLIDDLIRYVEGRAPCTDELRNDLRKYSFGIGTLGDCLTPPQVKLVHVVRLAHAFSFVDVQKNPYYGGLWWHNRADLDGYRTRCQPPFGLRELDAAIAAVFDGGSKLIAEAYLSQNSHYSNFCDWEPAAIWPVFAAYPDVLKNTLNPPPRQPGEYYYGWNHKRHAAFRVLGMFPQLPAEYIPLLWDIALGESKSDRSLAQQALTTVPDKAAKILIALADGRQGVRAAAADWLGEIGDAIAVEPIKEAFRKEKQEWVKGAMMSALDALGADVNEFLDRDQLLKEAQASLKKKRPRGMEWVPLDRLPALHWADTGKPVDPTIVQWWVVQSVQQKSVACGPLLRRYLDMGRPLEAAALAKFLLTSWIGHDTRTMSHDEAMAKAKADAAKQWAQWGGQKYMVDFYGSEEKLTQTLYQNFSNQCLGSAIGEKGLLALVSAAGDQDCVKLCEQYVRKWFGNRLAQCKCLIEVLGWVKHPLAVQVLLSVANRFRTKALRQAAGEYVNALAEREGWTLDQLADRTIPDAGFARPTDAAGEPVGSDATLVLDYGPRKFTVKLSDELQPVVTRDDGKTVKEPPPPAKDDDAEKAKAAKKAFSEAKKTVKDVVKRQAERLYEALCTQRLWRFNDWQRYLGQHPIVGKLCCRLVWAAFAPPALEAEPEAQARDARGPFLGCFRPLEDSSLTDEKDEAVTLRPDTLITLAHTCNVPANLEPAWTQHLQDYDVTPPFQQFGRPTYQLPESKQKETDVADFEGHCLTTFKLRGKATKLGYVRGDAEDGGSFRLYRKPFPSLELQAVIEFTGSFLPEQDIAAALEKLFFTPLKSDQERVWSWQPQKMPLGKVPPVLLSECYNDLKQIAADGSGYDPKWQEKSYF